MSKLLAFDLGAESGRAIVGNFDGRYLKIEELHRFANGPVSIFNRLYWDPLRLFAEMQQGLALFAREHGSDLAAIGVDTWGVDYALLDDDDSLLDNPRNYRDQRTDGMLEAALNLVPRAEIFQHTGVQFMKINTLYQIFSQRESPSLQSARTFLMMADLFNFYLTGNKVCEFSNATTTQFYDPRQNAWATALFDQLGLPTHFLPEIVQPGTQVGTLLPTLAAEAGLPQAPVIAPATHDTGSAVAAVPTETRNYAYISSGTWSLMGVELDEPLVSDQALQYNFTNEGGVGPTYRFLKNIMGLWLMQECRRTWAREGRDFSYDELTALAQNATPFTAFIEPDDERFFTPGDMPARIRTFCEETGQAVPRDEGQIIRIILESLALKYRYVLNHIETVLGRQLEVIHIIGGGIQNGLLCQFTASATDQPVVAGPLEATAIGNLLLQLIGLGQLDSLADARQVIRRSFASVTYEPDLTADWDTAYDRFCSLIPSA